MNKILKCLCLFTLMVFTLTGCRDDAELADNGVPGNPEKEVVGKYIGTWAVTSEGVTTDYEGTLTITEKSQYVGLLHIECPGRNIDVECMVNIFKQNPNIRFYNELPANTLGAAFTGSVTPEGNISMVFTKIEKQGRKSFVYDYIFDGKR